MNEEKLEIGGRVKLIRKNLGLSQKDFAEKIDMKTQYLSNVENGLSGLTIEKVKCICRVANVSADYIIFGSDSLAINSLKESLSEYTDADISKSLKILKEIVDFYKHN